MAGLNAVNTSKKKLKKIKTILISQAKPEGDRSPYFDLEKKFNVKLTFCPFVTVEGVTAKEFRQQKIDLATYGAIIFTSRYAVDHFFRLCNELRHKVNPEMKFFCLTEAVALYLQKFILYRKRKVFYSEDGSIKGLLQCIGKNKSKTNTIVPNSDAYRNDICSYLQQQQIEYKEAQFFRTVNNDVSDVLAQKHDLIVLFSPGGIKSLTDGATKFEQKNTIIGAFGPTTCKLLQEQGYEVQIQAPCPDAPSMVGALEIYLQASNCG